MSNRSRRREGAIMTVPKEAAAPMGATIGNGRSVVSVVLAAQDYPNSPDITTVEYPVAALAILFRRPIATALEICRLSGSGGAI